MEEKPKRTTIYFDAETLRALKMKAVVMERSVSYLVNDAVKKRSRNVEGSLISTSRMSSKT